MSLAQAAKVRLHLEHCGALAQVIAACPGLPAPAASNLGKMKHRIACPRSRPADKRVVASTALPPGFPQPATHCRHFIQTSCCVAHAHEMLSETKSTRSRPFLAMEEVRSGARRMRSLGTQSCPRTALLGPLSHGAGCTAPGQQSPGLRPGVCEVRRAQAQPAPAEGRKSLVFRFLH